MNCAICNKIIIEKEGNFYLPMLDGKIEYDVDAVQTRVCKDCFNDEKWLFMETST